MFYILLLIIIFVIAFMYWRLSNKLDRVIKTSGHLIAKQAEEYRALDQGMTEITDAYESDSLAYEETIAKLNEEKSGAQKIIAADGATISRLKGQKGVLMTEYDRVVAENIGIRRQLDIAQTIISEHDANCLPHIVLTSMETEKDTPLPLEQETEWEKALKEEQDTFFPRT